MKVKTIATLVLTATALSMLSGCGRDSKDKPAARSTAKAETASRPRSADEEFDATYLKNVRTVTDAPELEMELYRKAARKSLAQLDGADIASSVAQRGITMDDYRKMVVDGLVKQLQEKLRSARREIGGDVSYKVLLQGIINSL